MNTPYYSTSLLPELPLWSQPAGRRVPFSFDLELTARCNCNCRHCYINLPAGDERARQSELSLAEIEAIAGEAVQMGALWCLITGGEPLLRPDFPDVYRMLKRMGLLVSVFTNACLVNREHVQLFRRYPPRDIEVTVYGATRATYERVTRKPGSYAAFRRGLGLLQDAGLRVRLKAMALRSNYAELPAIAAFCLERTTDFYRFDPLLHLRYDGDPARNALINLERLSPQQVVALEKSDPARWQALQAGCKEQLVCPEMLHNTCDHLFHCGAGLASFSVSYDGKFRLCSSLCQPGCVYDLRQGKELRPLRLREAWVEFVPQVRALRSQEAGFLENCRRCPVVNLCMWCPANAGLETGRLDAWVGEFCEMAYARASALAVDKG